MEATALQIDKTRMQEYFLEIAKIGATPLGGVTRLALTDEDKAGRDLFIRWLKELGASVRFDDVGNIYGHYAGQDDALPPVLIGSHLDTVFQGGKFDGTLGVMAGLEVLHTLHQEGIKPLHPIELISFTNEEGVRFQPAVLASGVVSGEFTLDFAYSRADQNGKTLGDELERIGYKGSRENRSSRAKAYLEMHIEQGPILEELELNVGVVEGIQGATWLEITLVGQANHTGTTPMNRRRDALVAAAGVITGVREIGCSVSGSVATVGRLRVEPNFVNGIPGKVVLSVDIRNPDNARVEEARQLTYQLVERVCQAERIEHQITDLWTSPTVMFNPAVVDTVEKATKDLGYRYQRMMSGAGHDAMYMAQICPTGMIFVPTIDGKSHCQEESAVWDEVEKATNVLLGSVLALAGK